MIINDSSILLGSKHTSLEKHTRKESLEIWKNSSNPGGNKRTVPQIEPLESSVVTLSPAAKSNQPKKAELKPIPEDELLMADLNTIILRKLIERITGKVLGIKKFNQPTSQNGAEHEVEVTREADQTNTTAAGPGRSGFGIQYNYYESHYEYESTDFSAQGIIRTADGREIDFDVQLSMSREFFTEQQIDIRAGQALQDPLVVNFVGNSAELTQTRFAFDIDMDGTEDQIAFTGPDSGFLALDRNNDNTINDGSELFGPETGSGFTELARYDEDENGWIDENDSIFDKLRIWMKDADGNDHLFSLGQKGIGAIYLNHIETLFSIEQDGVTAGKIRDTGLFLHENGEVGTIQQVDLAV